MNNQFLAGMIFGIAATVAATLSLMICYLLFQWLDTFLYILAGGYIG